MESFLDVLFGIENTSTFAYIIVLTTFIFFAIFLFLILDHIRKHKKWICINRQTALLILSFFILALLLRTFLFDLHFPNSAGDFFYTDTAKNIAEHGRFQMCDHSNYCLPPLKPYLTYPLITGLVFLATEPSVEVATILNVFISALSVVVMYFVTNSVFKDRKVALLSSLLLVLTIQHIAYANTISSHAFSIFFLLMTVLSYFTFFQKKEFKTHLLATVSAGLCISTRLDHWGLLPIVILWYFIERKEMSKLDRKTLFAPIIVFSLLIIPNAMMVYPFAFHEGSDASDFGSEYLQNSIEIVGENLTNIAFFQVWIIHLLGTVSFFVLLVKRKLIKASLSLPMFMFLSMFLFYEYSSIHNIRYLLPGSVLSIILISYLVWNHPKKIRFKHSRLIYSSLIIVLFIMPFVWWSDLGNSYNVIDYPLYEFTKENTELLNRCVLVQCEGRVSWALLDTEVHSFDWNPESVEDLKSLRSQDMCLHLLETQKCHDSLSDPQKKVIERYNLTLLKEEVFENPEEVIRVYEVEF